MRRPATLALMVLAAALLVGCGGRGAVTPPATTAPSDSQWARSVSNPILSPTVAWEQTAVVEPVVIREGGAWRMWYRGGWSSQAIGYATSPDGIAWTKYPGNPVYGLGGSGDPDSIALPQVTRVGSTYYMFAVEGGFGLGADVAVVATSTDGIAWTTQPSSITHPAGKTLWGNCTVWVEGSTWYRLQEVGTAGPPWEIYLYTSADGLEWTIANGGAALTSLQVAVGGMYGGPSFAVDADGNPTPKVDGLYQLWYHAAPSAGNLPTNIYHATSTDMINWTIDPAGPVLTYAGSGFEVDQVADPSVLNVGGTAYMFYDGDDNAGPGAAHIGLATAAVPAP